MNKTAIHRRSLCVAALAALPLQTALAADAVSLEEVTVTGTREAQPKAETPATVQGVAGADVRDMKPTHPTELMGRISGVHVSITGGEGHQTAIRQPIGTSPLYLYLEDGVPTRSTGFFNHNALYEINVPQSGGVEVNKGPGSSLQGSDAIGGVVNVLTRAPSAEREIEGSVEYGSHNFMRGLASFSDSWDDDGLRASANVTHTDGWREKTGYDRQAATVRWDRFLKDGGFLKTVLTASNINQETAGSSRLYYDDYKNNPTENYTPISYRKVKAVRLSSAYENEDETSLLSLVPYLRWNEMDLMPNWALSYDPTVYTTGHMSAGLMSKYRMDFQPYRTRVVVGADLDYSPGWRDEWKISRTKVGNVYTDYSLDTKEYEYDVTFMSASPYIHAETSPMDKLRVSGGLRLDAMRYVYDNHLDVDQADNKHRRAADNTTNYMHASPKLGVTYRFTPRLNGFAAYKHAFRAPAEGTLFRQGSAADTMHLDPVKVDSFEIGVRGKPTAGLDYELSVYRMTKTDDILSYDNGTDTVKTNAGETLHQGVEAQIGYRYSPEWKLDAALSYAKHTYEEWTPEAGVSYAGNEMTSAPRWMGTTALAYSPSYLKGATVELEWVSLGEYWLDENNTNKYTGHNLLNLRGSYRIDDDFKVFGRVMNLTDQRYATSGKWSASKGLEFAPGMPLTAYIGVEATF